MENAVDEGERARTLASVKALYVIVAGLFVFAQLPVAQAACPSLQGVSLRSCCCEKPAEPVATSDCCGSEAEAPAHEDCSCALAPAAESDAAIQSSAPALNRAKLPTAHQPDEGAVAFLPDSDHDMRLDVLLLQQSSGALPPHVSPDTPTFIRLCSILR